MLDTIIKGGLVYSDGKLVRADIGVKDGKVAVVGDLDSSTAARTVDAKGQWVLPGAIDAHFHCRFPAKPEREDFYTGTCAAAAGGITLIMEMPISKPGVYNGEILARRREMADKDVVVDYALYSAPGTAEREDIESAVDQGAIAFKIFMHHAPAGREDEFHGLCVTDDGLLHATLELVAETGLVCASHCEDGNLIDYFARTGTERIRSMGREPVPADYPDYLRPIVLETHAVARFLSMGEDIGARVHVVHASSPRSVELVTQAKARGVNATVETCHHYLELDQSLMETYGPYAKVNPPFRTRAEREELWRQLRNDEIDIIASDHAPFTYEEKEVGWDNILAAPSGTPGIEVMVPYVMDQVLQDNLSLEKAVHLLSDGPADLFGIDEQKGRLLPGRDADFMFFDPEGEWKVVLDRLKTKAWRSNEPWAGYEFKGKITSTWVRGQEVYDGDSVTAERGGGRFVRPD